MKYYDEKILGSVVTLCEFTDGKNKFKIHTKRDYDTADGYFISVLKNDVEIKSRCCKTFGVQKTNKTIFSIKKDYLKNAN